VRTEAAELQHMLELECMLEAAATGIMFGGRSFAAERE
jgi:hypothetical protein